MWNRLFPREAGNDYRGYKTAILILAAVVLLKLVMAYAALFDTRDMLETADSIPLDRFGPAGAAAVVTTTKLLGLDHGLLNIVALAVLIRWRTLIPFAYLVLLAEQIGRKALALLYPIERTGVAYLPIDPNIVLAAALLIGFALSMSTPRRAESLS